MTAKWTKPGTRCARFGMHTIFYYFTCVDCGVKVQACEECDVCLTSCTCGNYQSIDTVTA